MQVRGTRPRAAAVLACYHQRLLAAVAFAGTGLITGGRDRARRNIITQPTGALGSRGARRTFFGAASLTDMGAISSPRSPP